MAGSDTGLWAIAERLDAICRELPEVTVNTDDWARLFTIRRNHFCLFTARQASGSVQPVLVLRAETAEREALLAMGPPYAPNRGGYDRYEVVLDEETDWSEIRELVIDSYRKHAPKKLQVLLQQGGSSGADGSAR